MSGQLLRPRRRLLGAVLLGSALAAGLLLLFRGSASPERAGRAPTSSAVRVAVPAPPAPSSPLERSSPVEPAPVAASTAQQPPASEDAFLQQLLELNRTDKPRALELARRGEGWYSDEGVRAEARKAMIVTLLVDLGHMHEARAAVHEFIRRYPDSRYRRLVQGVTGIHPRPGAPTPTP